jgi:23S rRNA (guanosine2251-2'-O)-methyltransferase
VGAALANPERTVRKILGTREALAGFDLPADVPVTYAEAMDLARLVPGDAPHQGVVIEVEPLEDIWLSDLLADAPKRAVILVLDQVTDPHNVGAILRSAAAFAVKAIVTTARHSPEATGVLAKSASGALEMVPLVTVQNLARALNELNDRGFMTVGLDSEGSEDLGAVTLQQPLALVLGAEGKGLRQLTRDTCSVVARLDMPGEIKSLNVSNAAVLALYIGASRLGLMK